MKKIILIFLLVGYSYSQKSIHSSDFSGYNFGFSSTLNKISIIGLCFDTSLFKNSIFGMSFAHCPKTKSTDQINEVGIGITTMFNKDKIHKKALFSGYTQIDISAAISKFGFNSYNFGIGFFNEYKYLIPEIFINYNLVSGAVTSDYYMDLYNQLLFGFSLNSILRISQKSLIMITPSVVYSKEIAIYTISIGFTYNRS